MNNSAKEFQRTAPRNMRAYVLLHTRHHARRKHEKAQIAPLFALMIPVILALMALSITGEIYLNTSSQLNQAAYSAALASSSDACLASAYSYEQYMCQAFNNGPVYGSTQAAFPGGLPIPASTPQQNTEQSLTLQAGETMAKTVLSTDYPSPTYTITDCTGSSTTVCAGDASTTDAVAFQVNVSYQFVYDSDDISGNPFSTSAPPSDDANAATGAPVNDYDTSSGGFSTYPYCQSQMAYTPPSPFGGADEPTLVDTWDSNVGYCLQHSVAFVPAGDVAQLTYGGQTACSGLIFSAQPPWYRIWYWFYPQRGNPAVYGWQCSHYFVNVHPATLFTLYCPATQQFTREVSVDVWLGVNQPFGAFLGSSKTTMYSTSSTFGCVG